jgi:hypothetical protein
MQFPTEHLFVCTPKTWEEGSVQSSPNERIPFPSKAAEWYFTISRSRHRLFASLTNIPAIAPKISGLMNGAQDCCRPYSLCARFEHIRCGLWTAHQMETRSPLREQHNRSQTAVQIHAHILNNVSIITLRNQTEICSTYLTHLFVSREVAVKRNSSGQRLLYLNIPHIQSLVMPLNKCRYPRSLRNFQANLCVHECPSSKFDPSFLKLQSRVTDNRVRIAPLTKSSIVGLVICFAHKIQAASLYLREEPSRLPTE